MFYICKRCYTEVQTGDKATEGLYENRSAEQAIPLSLGTTRFLIAFSPFNIPVKSQSWVVLN